MGASPLKPKPSTIKNSSPVAHVMSQYVSDFCTYFPSESYESCGWSWCLWEERELVSMAYKSAPQDLERFHPLTSQCFYCLLKAKSLSH